MTIIRGEDGKYIRIKDATNINISVLDDVDGDDFDPDEIFYEEAVLGMPYIYIQYTITDVVTDMWGGMQQEPVEESDTICVGDTILFAGERMEFNPKFDDITIPKWRDFTKYVRNFTEKLNNNFSVANALRSLEGDDTKW